MTPGTQYILNTRLFDGRNTVYLITYANHIKHLSNLEEHTIWFSKMQIESHLPPC